jgi:serine protease
MKSKFLVKSFVACAVVLLVSCGGGGSSSSAPAPTPTPALDSIPPCGGSDRSPASTSTQTPTACGGPTPPVIASAPIAASAPVAASSPTTGITARTISGTISIAENSAVDSDTNDPNQPNRASNNDGPSAQKLVSPFALVGSVNLSKTGPQGPNFTAGDDDDFYTVSLQAGQVVELEFNADAQENALGLGVIDEASTVRAVSVGVGNTYECVRITKTANYLIWVGVFKGASIYNMRVGAPNSNSSCPNATEPIVASVQGQIVTKRVEKPDAQATQMLGKAQRDGDAQMKAATASSDVPVLWQLPSAGADRVNAMARVSALSGGANAFRKTSQSTVHQKETESAAQALLDEFETAVYAKQLMATGLFEYVERNRVFVNKAAGALVGAYPPNDRLYTNQRWHYEMIGMPAAMERLVTLSPQPTTRPLVAVIDSGIVADHPDLTAQIEHQASFTKSGTFSTDANDRTTKGEKGVFHGSHVAGTVAAATFDGVGAAGVAPMAKLMPVNVFVGLYANSFDIAQGILYAAGLPNSSGKTPPRRADVINLSLGSEVVRACVPIEGDAIRRARAAGVLVVASSGNEYANMVNSPANCPGAISVGAVGAMRQKTDYSNAGTGLTVTAPGGDDQKFVFSTVAGFTAAGVRVPDYGSMNGTSMAAPHVSGVMALMRFVNPAITPDQVSTAFAAGQLTDDLGSAGYDTSYGWGLINARKAVDVALALKGGTPVVAVQGTVVAQPSSLDMGALRTSAELTLAVSAQSNENVTSVVSASPAVTVVPAKVDPTTKLGTYTVTVNRAALPEGGSFVNLQVTTSTARQFNVQISVQKNATGITEATASVGQVYVLILDPQAGKVIAEIPVTAANGRYAWKYSGQLPAAIQVIAGTDVDNDGYLIARGETCGAFPTLGSQLPIIQLQGNRSDLNFSLAPFGGFAVKTASGSAPAPWTRLKRLLEGDTP